MATPSRKLFTRQGINYTLTVSPPELLLPRWIDTPFQQPEPDPAIQALSLLAIFPFQLDERLRITGVTDMDTGSSESGYDMVSFRWDTFQQTSRTGTIFR